MRDHLRAPVRSTLVGKAAGRQSRQGQGAQGLGLSGAAGMLQHLGAVGETFGWGIRWGMGTLRICLGGGRLEGWRWADGSHDNRGTWMSYGRRTWMSYVLQNLERRTWMSYVLLQNPHFKIMLQDIGFLTFVSISLSHFV